MSTPKNITWSNTTARFFAHAPWHRFEAFIAPQADRFCLLTGLLQELALAFQVVPVAGNRHVFVFPGPGIPLSPVILVAHYDRADGSPGANDNSAAVFQLVDAAIRLKTEPRRQWLIIFTDKEELNQHEGVRDQGAYTLARVLRASGLGDAPVFIFDACGTGDSLIISTTEDYLLKKLLTQRQEPWTKRMSTQLHHLSAFAETAATWAGYRRVWRFPTPLSDDAGFLRGGIAAQTMSVLPADEAAAFSASLRTRPGLAEGLLSREARAAVEPAL